MTVISIFHRFLILHFLTKPEGYWIGLKRRYLEEWYWIENNTTVYRNNEIWLNGEPNNSWGVEDCGELTEQHSIVGANDEDCSDVLYGICEKSATQN